MAPHIGPLPDNVLHIWHYGFTEMFNNAIDHSDYTTITVHVEQNALFTEIRIFDDGVGIFRKIQRALKLTDERHAVLELAKGKLTTDPERHTGEGIFFSSRMFDNFAIMSGETYFSHDFGDPEDWILDESGEASGTSVWMKLDNHTSGTVEKIFNTYSSPDEYGFTKTVVPVRLAQYGDDLLVSRPQAKRLLARIDRFKTVIFDFSDVTAIGQAFADEIFRVFARRHPHMELVPVKANSSIEKIIERARNVI